MLVWATALIRTAPLFNVLTRTKAWLCMVVVACVASTPALACLGPMSERAQESDASVLFTGQPVDYSQHPGPVEGVTSGSIVKITFVVAQTFKGPRQTNWTVLMRGRSLPKSLADFKRRFGNAMTVGLREFGAPVDSSQFPVGFQFQHFVVDAACSMNGGDWLLRPVSLGK